ncbi:response regulator [Marinoscillum pacificum]|uniref:response regulator n=1 Tax=Marinoscillum pacificum TaxID=392723 RepID=UPI002157AD1D|nr:response regulator [Marinoscillum pacificum]
MEVLIVEDSVYMRAVIRTVVTKYGMTVVGEAKNGVEAIDMALELNPDLITVDNVLPDMLGLDILKSLQEENLKAKKIMISAVGDKITQSKAAKLGALAYIVKPFEPKQLTMILDEIFSHSLRKYA